MSLTALPRSRDGRPRTRVDFYPAGREGPRVQRILRMGVNAAKAWMREQIAAHQGNGPAGGRRTFGGLVEEFLQSRRRKGLSDSYLVELERDLASTMAGRWGKKLAKRVTTRMIEEYLDELVEKEAKPGTVKKHRQELFTMFRWATRRRLVPFNPVEAIEPPKLGRLKHEWLPPAAFAKLWDHSPDYLRPMLVPAITLGLRSAEIRMLPRSRVLPGMLRVHGKGNKERELPCPPQLREVLLAQPERPDGLVFTRPGIYHGQAARSDIWTADAFTRAVKTAARKAKLDSGVTPHTLRHSATSWMVAAGVRLRVVQEALGHESYTTTLRYEHARYMDWEEEKRALPENITTISLHVMSALARGGPQMSADTTPAEGQEAAAQKADRAK